MYLIQVKKKREEIRVKCNLPANARERTNELKEQFSVKVKSSDKRSQSPSTSCDKVIKIDSSCRERPTKSRSRSPHGRTRGDKDHATLRTLKSRDRDRNRFHYRDRHERDSRDRIRDKRSPEYRDRERREYDRGLRSSLERDRDRHLRPHPTSREGFYVDEISFQREREREMLPDYYSDGYRSEKWTSRANFYGIAPHRPPASSYYPTSKQSLRSEAPAVDEAEIEDETLTCVSVLR